MSFGDIPTRTATPGMEPFRKFLAVSSRCYQLILAGGCIISWRSSAVEKCYRGILLECRGNARWALGFYNLSDSVIVILYYILILSSLGRWYQSIYIYIQICTGWCHLLDGGGAEIECYTYYKFFVIFTVEWSCKWSLKLEYITDTDATAP